MQERKEAVNVHDRAAGLVWWGGGEGRKVGWEDRYALPALQLEVTVVDGGGSLALRFLGRADRLAVVELVSRFGLAARR